jgi:hypothetical protein
MAIQAYTHKRGATLDLSGKITTSVVGEVVPDFTNWVGAAQIRRQDDSLADNLVFEWLDVAEGLVRVHKTDTSTWPLGPAEIDIRFTNSNDSSKVFTTTQQIMIVKEITRACT